MPTPNHPAEAQSTPLGWQVAHGSCVIQMRAPYPRLYPHVTPQLSGKVKQFAYQFTHHGCQCNTFIVLQSKVVQRQQCSTMGKHPCTYKTLGMQSLWLPAAGLPGSRHVCLQIQDSLVGALELHKNYGSHIDASHSRQPLVKGERLVRYEVNAVIAYRYTGHFLPKKLLD